MSPATDAGELLAVSVQAVAARLTPTTAAATAMILDLMKLSSPAPAYPECSSDRGG